MRCECTEARNGLQCKGAALWIVGVGTRQMDRQRSCGTHLNATCRAVLEAEKPRTVVLTVMAATEQEET